MRNNRPHIMLLLVAFFVFPALFLGTGTPTNVSADTLSVTINFQPSSASTPDGYLVDSGAAFGDRGNGWSYGWSSQNTETRDRNQSRSPDQRYDTLNHMQKTDGLSWEIALPDGTYDVHLVAGDPSYDDSVYKIAVEGTLAIDGTPDDTTRWLAGDVSVAVTDGRLTVSNASGSSNNKINYIEITATDGSSTTDPTTPPLSATSAASTEVIINVAAASGDAYPVESLQEGTRTFIDRSYSITDMPAGFVGQPFIRTVNDDKWATVPDFLRFELTAAATVYVAYDSRAQALPAWLAEGGWTETGDLLGTSDVGRRLYRKSFPAGPVVLGGNAMAPMLGAESNYNVVVIAEDAPAPATTPTATSVPADVPSATATATAIPSATATATAVPSATATATAVPTNMPESATLDQTGAQWAFLEWSLDNPTYSGNPFDLVASATFVHQNSGETRTTEMFYNGGDTWKFRFTGTQVGTWTVTTSSDDADLDRHTGTVTITSNSNPQVPGFITTVGNKFARQTGENGELEAYIYNVYQDNERYPADFVDLSYIQSYPPEQWARDYLALAREHGSNTLFMSVAHQWFELGMLSVDHGKVDPDQATFEIIERVIAAAHQEGGHVQLWMWGDNAVSRRWTPVGLPGGINGEVDKRLQRYIAARLGPLPGWTMGYGFDLEEWVSEGELQEWATYLNDHFGWKHLLWGRNRSNAALDVVSYNAITSARGPNSYADVVDKLTSDRNRPHLEEERFYHQRWGKYDMTTTRRHFWWYILAGGMGGHWGYHPNYSNARYPNPEQLATHRQFWSGRFTLDMDRANELSDGYVLKNAANTRYVFYKEDTTSISMDLTGMATAQRAVAVDTKKAYAEIDLGMLDATDHAWTAPYRSDWAIAIEP